MNYVNVLLLGLDSQIGQATRTYLLENTNEHLTILSEDPDSLGYDQDRQKIIKGSIDNDQELDKAMLGQDVVVVTLCKDVDKKLKKIITSMNKNDVKRIIFVGYMGPYEHKPTAKKCKQDATYRNLKPFAQAHKELENSNLDYTIIRSNWVTSGPVNYEISIEGMPFIEQDVSLETIASLIARLTRQEHLYERQSVGVTTPL